MNIALQHFSTSAIFRRLFFFIVPIVFAFSLIAAPAYAGGVTKKLKEAVEQRNNAVKAGEAAPAPDAANAKLGNRTCVCNISCMGQDRSTSSNFGQIFIITTPKRQQCADFCNQHISNNISTWAAEQKTCPSFSCGGDSKLSTGDSIGVGPTTIATPGCGGNGGGPASACCAPITGDDVYSQFQFNQASQGASTPYTMTFNANNTVLNDRMNAFATLAGLMQTSCRPSSIVYTITNVTSSAIMATITAQYNGTGAPSITTNPASLASVQFLPTNPASQYKVNAHAGCAGYTATECKDRGFIKTLGFSTFKVIGGADPSVLKY